MKYRHLACILLFLVQCGPLVVGSGGGNEEITGCVLDDQFKPSSDTRVTLRKIDDWRKADTSIQDTTQTDAQGRFRFSLNDTGTYTVEYNHDNRMGKLRKTIVSAGIAKQLTDTMRPLSRLVGTIDTALLESYSAITVYAVEIKKSAVAVNGTFSFSALPSGDYSLKLFSNDSIVGSPHDTASVKLKGGDSVYVKDVGASSGIRVDTVVSPLLAPSALTGVALSGSMIKISWDRVALASEYEIYKNETSGGLAIIGTTALCQFTDSQLTPGVTYEYRVSAISSISRSDLTQAIDVTTLPLYDSSRVFNIVLDSSALGQNSAIARVSVKELSDGFIVAAGTGLMKLGVTSAVHWSAKIDCIGRRVEQTNDKGFIVMGYFIGYDSGFVYLPRVTKTDSNGTELWRKDLERPARSLFTGESDFCLTSDGGCILASSLTSGTTRNTQTFITRTDVSVTTLWKIAYGDSVLFSESASIQQTSDLGFIIAANTFFPTGATTSGAHFINVLKINGSGDTVWTRDIGKAHSVEIFSVLQTNDGGYVAAGASRDAGLSGYHSSYIAKLNIQGALLWEKTSPDADIVHAAVQTRDGGFAFVGGTVDSNAVLYKTNADGDRVWRRVFSGKLKSVGYSVQQTRDGGFIIGAQYFLNFGGYPRVIKTDENGLSASPSPIP